MLHMWNLSSVVHVCSHAPGATDIDVSSSPVDVEPQVVVVIVALHRELGS